MRWRSTAARRVAIDQGRLATDVASRNALFGVVALEGLGQLLRSGSASRIGSRAGNSLTGDGRPQAEKGWHQGLAGIRTSMPDVANSCYVGAGMDRDGEFVVMQIHKLAAVADATRWYGR
jgi:hypothetical protein